MKSIALLLAFLIVFLSSTVATAQSPPPPSTSGYCSDIFNNVHNIVSNAFNNPSTYAGLLMTSLLIILMVLVVLSIVYAVGLGFGIDSLIRFAKTEYLESFFNVIIIAAVFGSMSYINNAVSFFSGLTNAAIGGVSYPPTSAGIKTLYIDLCNNIETGQINPSGATIIGILFTVIPAEIFATMQIQFQPTGVAASFLPGFSINPLQGIGPLISVTFLETATFTVFLTLGIAMIFLLFIIYFLFPLFLYIGIALRSFPWTRAAGGSFIAFFVSFFIVFPVLFYPFTVSGPYGGFSYMICVDPTTGKVYTNSALCSGGSALNVLGNVWQLFTSLLPSIIGNSGGAFVNNTTVYVSIISYTILRLIGLGIALIISFDLLEALGDFLGAPSLQAHRIMEKLI